MPKFKVVVEERNVFSPVVVEAEDYEEAEEKAIGFWYAGTVPSKDENIFCDTTELEERAV